MPRRRKDKIDANQPAIVEALRKIAGVSVQVDHDDILVGRQGKTYWFEIKDPEKLLKQDGTFRKGEIKDSQQDLLDTWTGHYEVVWELDQILRTIGLLK